MLLHIDGSKHQWLNDHRWHDLIVILDDATSEIYYAQLVEEESTRTVMASLREVIENKGLFCALFPRSVSEQSKGSLHVTFLLNFFDELRRRNPRQPFIGNAFLRMKALRLTMRCRREDANCRHRPELNRRRVSVGTRQIGGRRPATTSILGISRDELGHVTRNVVENNALDPLQMNVCIGGAFTPGSKVAALVQAFGVSIANAGACSHRGSRWRRLRMASERGRDGRGPL
jgi:hypothetical protein